MKALMRGVGQLLFDAGAASTGNSDIYALLPKAQLVTWQTRFGTAPASVTMQIQTSNDGTNFFATASSTTVGGELGSFQTAAKFIRARVNAISGGAEVTVEVVSKPLA